MIGAKNGGIRLFPAIERWLKVISGCYYGGGAISDLACKFKVAFMASRLKPDTTVEGSEPKLVGQDGGKAIR